jgi:dolichyl-phosphate beta-glucosyltransferase
MIYLSVIIPAYNEENRLPKTLRKVHEYLSKQSYDYEILVVNDGSKDRTGEVVENLKYEMRNLKLIDNKKNCGKGCVVRQGMLQAQGEYRVFMDADNATSVDHIEKMIPYFQQGHSVVIGSRDMQGAIIAVPQSWVRRRLGDVFNLIVQIIAGLWGVWDTQCGFKGFTAKSAQDIFSRTTIDRWAFDVEALVIAKKLGYKIKEVPVTWINDPESKVKLKGMIKMLLEVAKIRGNMLMGKYNQ